RGRMRANFLVQRRLSERWLVRLVVSVTTIADDVDQEVLSEFRPVLDRQSDHVNARLRIVGVDVNDRNFESLCQIAGVACRPRIAWIRRESDLIVYDDVKRPPVRKPVSPERLNVSATTPSPGNAASPCTQTGSTAASFRCPSPAKTWRALATP